LSLLRAAVKPVVAMMKKRKRPIVKRLLPPTGVPPVAAQTTPSKVKIHTHHKKPRLHFETSKEQRICISIFFF